MNLKVDLEEPNTIVVRMDGVFEEAEVDPMYDKFDEISKQVGTINLLADMSKLANIPPKAREKVKNRGKEFTDFKHIAIFGAKPAVRVLGGLLLKILPVGKGETRFFKTEEEARTWLEKN